MRHNTKGKRFLAFLLAAVLMLSVCPLAASAEDSTEATQPPETTVAAESTETAVTPEPTETTVTSEPTETTVTSEPTETTIATDPVETTAATEPPETTVTTEPTKTSAATEPTETTAVTEPEEVSEAVKAFLEAVKAIVLPEELNEETGSVLSEQIGAAAKAYDALSEEELAREDVQAAAVEMKKAMDFLNGGIQPLDDEPIVPVNAPDAPTANANISKSKTATKLDTNFESQVTLSLPSAEEPVGFDVVFVIDKSESPDKDEVSKAVGDLLDKIKNSKGTVNIGVVTFNKEVANSLSLTPLTDSNLKTIQDAIEFSSSSGTNIHAGLTNGMEILNAGKNTGRQYLILVSDGITYLYNDENGQGPKTINNHGQSSPDDYAGKYKTTDAPADGWEKYLDDIATLVNADGTTYEGKYVSRNDIQGAKKGLYGGGGYGNDALEEHAMSVDKALLRTYEAYVEAMGKYGKNHVYAVGRENSEYPWAGSFMDYLSSISAKKTDIDTIVTEDILYLVANGSKVTDYIGSGTDNKGNSYNFDFVNDASKLWMTIGDEKYEAASNGENKYVFKKVDGTTAAYELTYYPDSEAEAEHFVWNINEPIRNDTRVQLTYTVKLTNPQEDPGTYGEFDSNGSQNKGSLYTNNSATLYPQGSDGTPGTSQEFSKPTVSYTVRSAPVVPYPLPDGEWEVSRSKTATNLDEDYKSNITLSLPSASYQGSIDVAFILDGSTSADQSELANQAAELVGELAAMENLNVKVSLTIFGGTTPLLENTGLMDISIEANLTSLQNKLTDKAYEKMDGRSGSNLQAGVEAARKTLAADTTVNNADKYLIILSDGGARLWVNNAGEAVSKVYNYGGRYWGKSNYDYIYYYGCQGITPKENFEPRSFEDVWTANVADIDAYSATKAEYDSGALCADNYQTDPNYYPTYEAATYHAALSIAEASSASNVIYVSYPYYGNSGEAYTTYIEGFKSWLANKGYVTLYNSADMTDSAIFDAVKDELIQVVDSGSKVVDVIGYGDDYDFQFVNDINTLTMTVGGKTLDVSKIDDTTYGFGRNGKNFDFVLHYYPNGNGDVSDEHFVWDINVPVTKDETVQLTYTVKLTNPKKAAGTYGIYDADGSNATATELYTNNYATLYPVDSNGNKGDPQDFPKPTVSYEVKKTDPEPNKPTEPDPTVPDPTDPEPTDPEPDYGKLTIDKSANRTTVRPGKTITYTIKVTNKTGVDLEDITVSEKLDGNLTFVSASGDGSYSVKDGLWTISELKNGKTAKLTIKATVKSGVKDGTVIKNTVVITDVPDTPSDTVKVTVSNKISLIPQTGDTSSIGLWIGVMVACAVVLGVVLIFTVKKKKTR